MQYVWFKIIDFQLRLIVFIKINRSDTGVELTSALGLGLLLKVETNKQNHSSTYHMIIETPNYIVWESVRLSYGYNQLFISEEIHFPDCEFSSAQWNTNSCSIKYQLFS